MTDEQKAREGKRLYMIEYRKKNKEHLANYQKEYKRKWRINNLDKVKMYNDRYFAKKLDFSL